MFWVFFRMCIALNDSILQAAWDSVLREQESDAAPEQIQKQHRLSGITHLIQTNKWPVFLGIEMEPSLQAGPHQPIIWYLKDILRTEDSSWNFDSTGTRMLTQSHQLPVYLLVCPSCSGMVQSFTYQINFTISPANWTLLSPVAAPSQHCSG